MKIAVFSDTHGSTARMLRAAEELRPDALVHLGDYERDADCLGKAYPGVPLYRVCGNCDVSPHAPTELVVEFGPVRALLCHGHRYAVDWGRLDSLCYAAQEKGCTLALFGHTHQPQQTQCGGVLVVNPGTAGKGRRLTWALIEVMNNGGIAVSINKMEDNL